MTRTLPISEARKELTRMPERLRREPAAVEITKRGRPVLALMPWEHYQSLIETLEVLADPELVQALQKSLHDIRKGRTYSTAQARRKLGL